MRKSLWVVLALLVVFARPKVSYAQEIDYLQSFGSGLQTLTGETQNEQVTPEKDFMQEYQPKVQEVQLRTEPTEGEELTQVEQISGVADAWFTIPAFSQNMGPIQYIVTVLMAFMSGSAGGRLVATAAGLVFLWWGVRKSKNIIMAAFRSGRLNLGTSVKRAYYKRKAKEWYG